MMNKTAIAILRFLLRLGRCCVELHCGMVLMTLFLFVLAFTKLRRKMGQNGSNFVFQNSPIMQFERSPKLANIHVDNLRVLFKQKKLHCVPVSLASLRVTEATSRGHIACNIAG